MHKRWWLGLVLVLSVQGNAGIVAQSASSHVEFPSLVVVISDLHFGEGEIKVGEYHPFEDFQWGEDFVPFLDALHRAGGGRATLVIAGDMFELWQSDANDCVSAAPQLGCSEEEALARIQKILRAHRIEMQALGAFASRGENRVVIIPGNHDAALVYKNVWEAVVASTRARRDRLLFADKGYWVTPDGRIFVEHGHQFDDANRFRRWPMPMAPDTAGVTRLEAPFGERLVREFYDPIEREFPVMDNIAGSAGPLYGIRTKGLVGTAGVLAEFLKFVALKTSWRQFSSFLAPGDEPPPTWNLPAARLEGAVFLANSVAPDDPAAPLVREIVAAYGETIPEATATSLSSDDEVATLCQSRYVVNDELQRRGETAALSPVCPQTGGDLGYIRKAVVTKIRGEDFYLYRHLETKVAPTPELQRHKGRVVYVYGHTHGARPPERAQFQGLERYTIVNTGAWQRLVSGATVAAMGHKPTEVLQKFKLEQLPPCYSLVWIKYDTAENLEPKLRYWLLESDGVWRFTTACDAREMLPSE